MRAAMSESSPLSSSPVLPAAPPGPAGRWRLPRSRWARGLLYAVGVVLALWALLWLAAPPLIRWQGEKIASEQLGRPVRIGAVDFRPWSLELTLSDLSIGGAPGAPDLLKVKRVYADAELQSLLRLAPVVDAIRIDAPELRLARLSEGHYDIDDLLARLAAPSTPPAEPARFAIYNIQLTGGRIDFDDRVASRRHELRDLRLELPFISNMPSQRRVKVQSALAFVLNGSAFDSNARALPFDDSHQTEATLRLTQFDLQPYLGYIPAGLPLQLRQATLDADLSLNFEQTPRPSLRVSGTLAVNGLKAVDAQGADALAFDALKLQLGDVRPLERKVRLTAVELSGPRVTLRRRPDGKLSVLAQPQTQTSAADATKAEAGDAAATDAPDRSDAAAGAAPSASSASTADAAKKAGSEADWQIAVDQFAVHGGALDFTDATTAQGKTPAAVLHLTGFELSAATLAYPLARPFTFKGAVALAGAGRARRAAEPGAAPPATPSASAAARAPSIEFEGQAGPQGGAAKARAAAVPLALAAPYLAPYLVARLTGDLSANVDLQWMQSAPSRESGQPPRLKINVERLALSRLLLTGPLAAASAPDGGGLSEELFSCKLLRVDGLDVRVEPGQAMQVDVKDTLLSDFYARILIRPDGRINLQDLLRSPESTSAPAETSAGSPAKPESPAPVIHVGPVRLANGKVYFSDHFIRPNYSADLSELNGTLGAFSSVAPAQASQPQMAALQITGRVQGSAALQIGGQINPLAVPLALDIQGKVTDLELPPLTPYAVKYAGHGIERGKFSMDVAYRVQPDGQLTASNRLVLNQLEFGDAVAGAPASLPVRLATALLSDSQGVIDIDLPISGSLNDPQFSLGPIIFKAIVNLIGKAITAPFSLLANLLGGGQDMSRVTFAPGSAQLDAPARAQLDKVAKALTERPRIKLTVTGVANLEAERDGYRRERLKTRVEAERRGDAAPAPQAADVAAAAAPAPAPSETSADDDYARALRRFYRRADIPDRPRDGAGALRDISVPEMEALLMARIPVPPDAMDELAVQRGVAVKDYLAGKGLPADRLFLGAPRTAAASTPAAGAAAPGQQQPAGSPRAELVLEAR